MVMKDVLANWKAQIRKGYLELCVLCLVKSRGRLYGVELLEALRVAGVEVKEGTIYPMLNRMSLDGLLKAQWETEGAKGHPRKFYSLTNLGLEKTLSMTLEFSKMYKVIENFETRRNETQWETTKSLKTI